MPLPNRVDQQSHVLMPASAPPTEGSRPTTQTNGHGQRASPSVGEASGMPGAAMEPIAVVGMALKFPQGATSPAGFWEMLTQRASARTEVPGSRFNAKAFHMPDGKKSGTSATKHGHFIKEDPDRFDAQFFSIAPHEAECMDPQQRWLLEVSYQALENAGIPLQQINGTATSVHVGSFMHEHELMIQKDQEVPAIYSTAGSATSMLANRLSWFYNLTGPSLQVDTACSSSLVALHLACQSIRTGEASMGIVCGSNVLCTPENFITLSNFNFLSPDGISHAFDEKANGYARGEGVAAVIIKPLSAALRDGDAVRAVIRGTGVNSDGHTPGITQPSSDAQARLIRETYQRFGLSMSQTHFFEAHGTGTVIGDPTEAQAIASVFHKELEHGSPLYVGAVKSNIGHLEGASGLAGLIKTVLVLERGVIPPNVWFNRLNPAINPDWGLRFPTEVVPWPTDGLRRASVNSFGFGGTNAHVIVDDGYHYLKEHGLERKFHRQNGFQENGQHENGHQVNGVQENSLLENGHPVDPPTTNGTSLPKATPISSPKLLVISTSDEQGIERLQDDLTTYFKSPGELNLSSLAHTLSERRTRLPWKAYSVVDSLQALPTAKFTPAARRKTASAKLCFVFTGQGAQWVGMGRELLEYPVFHSSLADSDATLRRLGCQQSILDALYQFSDSSILDRPEICQSSCTALQIALLDLISGWNVSPAIAVGHSSGEIAAAYSAGAISKATALAVAYYRGVAVAAALQLAQIPGGMVAVCTEHERLEALLRDNEQDFGGLRIACYNSPQNLTVSGDKAGIEKLRIRLEAQGVFAKVLDVPVAYHNSAHMSNAAKVYTAMLQDTDFTTSSERQKTVELVSTVTGTFLDAAADVTTPTYWVANLTNPVRFADAIDAVLHKYQVSDESNNEPAVHFIELGPHSTLKSAIRETLKGSDVETSYTSVLKRKQGASHSALTMAGKLFAWNQPISISSVNGTESLAQRGPLVDLPSYPFNHSKSYWLESRVSRQHRMRKFPHNPYLGTMSSDWNPLEARWTNRIILKEKQFIEHHKVNGAVVYPAAGMLVMAIEAARQLAVDAEKVVGGYRFSNVVFQKALVIPTTAEGVEAQFFLRKNESLTSGLATWYDFRLTVYDNKEWAQCCQGILSVEYIQKPLLSATSEEDKRQHKQNLLDDFAKNCTSVLTPEQNYDVGSKRGLEFGPMFRCLSNIEYGENGLGSAHVDLQKWRALDDIVSDPDLHLLHPASLDALFQVAFPAIMHQGTGSFSTLVPTEVRSMWISSDLLDPHKVASAKVFARSISPSLRSFTTTYTAYGAEQEQPCFFGDLTLTAIGSDMPSSSETKKGTVSLYNIVSKPDVDLLTKEDHSKFFHEPSMSDMDLITSKEFACFLAISNALKIVDSNDFVHLPSHLQRYVRWMRWQVQMTNEAQIGTQRHTFLQRLKEADNPAFREQLDSMLEASGPEGKLLVRIAQNLPRFLSGELDSLSYLFSDKLIEEFYRFETPAQDSLRNVQRYIDSMAHKNPGLRVLEVGAGTGGTTGYILDALQMNPQGETAHRFEEYCFTDISPSFFESAVSKFACDRLVCKTLDIEKDPEKQGFAMGEYDIVIASNVLHATRTLTTTLTNVRKLLKPGGKLVLVEGTLPEALRTAFIFGLLPGWWLGTEDNRQLSPLVTPTVWDELLRKASFEGIDVWLPDGPGGHPVLGGSMIATARSQPLGNGDVVSELAIIRSPSSEHQNALAVALQSFAEEAGVNARITTLEDYTDTGAPCVFLNWLDGGSLQKAGAEDLTALEKVTRSASTILWVTHNSQLTDPESLEQPAVAGLLRSLNSERETFSYILLSLEDIKNQSRSAKHTWKVITTHILDASLPGEEIREENGLLCISRITEAKQLEDAVEGKVDSNTDTSVAARVDTSRPMELVVKSPGLLNSLQFQHDERYKAILGDTEIEIQTRSSSFQFRDLLLALGQVGGKTLGTECSGVITRVGKKVESLAVGDRVVAVPTMDDNGAFRTIIQCEEYLAQKMPDNISFQEAAAIPISFMTAHYSLFDRARLQKGESILIHSGAGGLGQAAIQLAQLVEADIYVTVGSEEKAQLLQDLYNIPRRRILSSRSLDFADDIMRLTSGRGVDVVLNSLSGIALRKSFQCVARFGRFIEVGKRDIYSSGTDVALPMYPFSQNIVFASVDLLMIMYNMKRAVKLLADVMKLVGEGKVTAAQPLHVYRDDEFEKAFRFMQSGKSSGKIVVSFDVKDTPVEVTGAERSLFDPEATYLISGGLGGLGRSIAKWMTTEGAKNLILLSRSGGKSEKAKEFLGELEALGTRVLAPQCDISDEDAVTRALEEGQKSLPPIKGCIQGSMVLKSALFSNMSPEQWNDTVAPKIQGSWNLHRLLPRDLDFFILLSSLCGIFGGVGQSNYSYGSAYQDELAKYRISQGQRAISIDLGVMESVGYVAEHEGVGKLMRSYGLQDISEEYLHSLLKRCCRPTAADQSQVLVGLMPQEEVAREGLMETRFLARPLCRHLHRIKSNDNEESKEKNQGGVDVRETLRAVETMAVAQRVISKAIQVRLSELLVIDLNDIDGSKPLHAFGVDSLVAIEMRNWFDKVIGADVPVFAVLSNMSVDELALQAAETSSVVPEGAKQA